MREFVGPSGFKYPIMPNWKLSVLNHKFVYYGGRMRGPQQTLWQAVKARTAWHTQGAGPFNHNNGAKNLLSQEKGKLSLFEGIWFKQMFN